MVSYRIKSKWVWLIRLHSFSGEHREVGLRPTKDHTVVTSTTTATNITAMKMGEQARGERKGKGRGRENERERNL